MIVPTGSWRRLRRATFLVLALSVGPAVLPLGGTVDGTFPLSSSTAAATGATPSAKAGRLDVAAAALRREPLFLDEELTWMLDADEARKLRRELRAARVPLLVAFLPSLTEDESGGDSERVLQALQRKVGRDALYVTVDQDGRLDLASVGLPLDFSIPYSVLPPPRDERPYAEQADKPLPSGWKTVPDRLRRILRYVRDAESGTPNAVIDDVRPLADLPGRNVPDDDTQALVVTAIVGLVIGGFFAGIILAICRGVLRRSAQPPKATRRRRGRRA